MAEPAAEKNSAFLRIAAARLVLARAELLVQAFPVGEQPVAKAALAGSRLAEIATLDLPQKQESELTSLGQQLLKVFPLEAALVKATKESPPRAPALALRRLMAHSLGQCLDVVRGIQNQGSRSGDRKSQRRSSGSYFTPAAVAQSLIARSMSHVQASAQAKALKIERVCDPAAGGGAFLIEAALALCALKSEEQLPQIIDQLYGADLDELALATTEVALYFLQGDPKTHLNRSRQFVVGNALLDETWEPLSHDGYSLPQFDWVVGNPPWVGFQGRAAQVLSPELRSYYRERYVAFRGYPSLQGLFVQRAGELSSGLLSLLLPSSVSDLEGYRNARACLRSSHKPAEPLLEYGQDAFLGVTQPCFGLVALPTSAQQKTRHQAQPLLIQTQGGSLSLSDNERAVLGQPWQLEERARAGARALTVEVPPEMQQLSSWKSLPPESFRELGFQSNPTVREAMFLRTQGPSLDFPEPLLEGRVVSEFQVRPARVYIREDKAAMKKTRCRFRPLSEYEACPVLIRQTAAFTIAARSNGQRFRNSLIAGYETEAIDADLLVALLNSALFRALHISRQRDARQATFPQVKLGHLRGLPCPSLEKLGSSNAESLRRLSAEMSRRNEVAPAERAELNRLTYELFGLKPGAAVSIENYLKERAPRALGL